MAMPNTARPWTLEELHRFPDDGNKYELVDGELFVTPAPIEPPLQSLHARTTQAPVRTHRQRLDPLDIARVVL